MAKSTDHQYVEHEDYYEIIKKSKVEGKLKTYYIKIDKDDFKKVKNKEINFQYVKGDTNKLYVVINNNSSYFNKKYIYLHRYILNLTKDDLSYYIIFANNDRTDFRKENLVILPKSHSRLVSKGSKETRGVTKSGDKYVAKIAYFGKIIYLGTFDTLEEALEVYEEERKKVVKAIESSFLK